MFRISEGSENYRNRASLIKEKFSTQAALSQIKNDPASLMELKKLDLFDLGVLLTIAATGGLDVISEEYFTDISSSCCLIHAF